MGVLGFDFERGRLDRAVHPFCGGAGVHDVRVTSRYAEDDLLSGLLAIIHETGHALYEQGRDPARADQPVSRARSMGWHESQSLLWENQVGRSAEFWRFLLPWLGERLPVYKGAALEAITRALARVDFQNEIRVEADELTYPLHVILRYELERDLFVSELALAELPAAWGEKMRDYLGVDPADDRRGVLQDIHWAGGAFGYFPSYTLGAMLAAQIFQAALRAEPAIPGELATGETARLRTWLRDQVHVQGSRLQSDALARAVTGAPLGPDALIDHRSGQNYELTVVPQLGGVRSQGDEDRAPGLASGPDLLAERLPAGRSQRLLHEIADALEDRRVAPRPADHLAIREQLRRPRDLKPIEAARGATQDVALRLEAKRIRIVWLGDPGELEDDRQRGRHTSRSKNFDRRGRAGPAEPPSDHRRTRAATGATQRSRAANTAKNEPARSPTPGRPITRFRSFTSWPRRIVAFAPRRGTGRTWRRLQIDGPTGPWACSAPWASSSPSPTSFARSRPSARLSSSSRSSVVASAISPSGTSRR
ncbi:MAG: hypothetical protein IPK80_19495 [Nannocystis sp.]|nr:hypothetical protein [Nannocystis sp.]